MNPDFPFTCRDRGRLATLRALALGTVAIVLALVLAACGASQPIVVSTTPGPQVPATPATAAGDAGAGSVRPSSGGWRIDTREHVDLWLHGFAMLQDDPSLVPYFRPGYRAAMQGVRGTVNTQLDVNRAELQRRFGTNANLTSAQFLVLYFANWDEMRRGVERFLSDNGDVQAARSQEELRMYATIRTYFPTSDDRDWLRLFMRSLDDERSRFYRSYWIQQEQLRSGQRAAILSYWSGTYGTALGRFMRNNAQRQGTILLSLPLGGEGRSLAVGPRDNFITVNFPDPGDDPRQALYVIAHEVVGSVATAAVRDNASAADERSGEAGKWATLAAVRGGALLLERVAPDLLSGYQRYYLSLARVNGLAGDVSTQFAATFPLPSQIINAIQRQIDVVLGGI
ncbi:MAG: hypothetical protein ABI910_07915 [Gemmatimonadota bacterium]